MERQAQHVVQDQQFVDQHVVLDGKTFERCSFTRCRLIYEGGAAPALNDCQFDQTDWGFDGAAARTVMFLNSLHRGGGKAIVDATIKQIRAVPKAPRKAAKSAETKGRASSPSMTGLDSKPPGRKTEALEEAAGKDAATRTAGPKKAAAKKAATKKAATKKSTTKNATTKTPAT